MDFLMLAFSLDMVYNRNINTSGGSTMKQFACTWNENRILTSISRVEDPYATVYLTSLGEMCLPDGVSHTVTWQETNDLLHMAVTVYNHTDSAVPASKIRFCIQANSEYCDGNPHVNYFERVLQKPCICGHGSFLYWVRPSGKGPHLAMIATGETALSHEINADPYQVAAEGDDLAPGKSRTYTFDLLWINNENSMQEALYQVGEVALDIYPGLTVPNDTPLLLFPRCKEEIRSLTCPNTAICRDEKGIYRIEFQKLGEHTITIHYGNGKKTRIECFSTHPIEELISLRAKHIVNHQQYRADKWYNGMFSQWSAIHRKMTTPDDPMELQDYMVCADDPGLCKAPYLAEKNVARPDEKQIAAIEYYIEHFVWGKLQRTDMEEPHPYGIYGSTNWKKNRESGTGYDCGGIGMERMWRTFDYTHLIQLYYNMYLIAKHYPQYVHYLDADGYLERARRTALAYFEVPYSIFMRKYWAHHGYSDWAFKQGNFHEQYILPLIEACHDEKLRYYWETKCKYMIYDNPLPYGSEMTFDSTAFESTEAVAHYAMKHGLSSDTDGWYDKNLYGPGKGGYRSHVIDRTKEENFLHCQMEANLACRGTQARSFYHLGSDYRSGGYKSYLLSYMTQMGGAAVLDYALYFDREPYKNLRTAYASMLAGFALINLGTEDPYYPHPDNLGAAGWAWQPEENGMCWSFMRCARGPWPYDGEIDSGLSGAIYASCSVLVNDPVFGLVCYGGNLQKEEKSIVIYPKDGVRRAFHAMDRLPTRLHLSIDRDAILSITLYESGNFLLECENITMDAHETVLTVNGKNYALCVPKEASFRIGWSIDSGAKLL